MLRREKREDRSCGPFLFYILLFNNSHRNAENVWLEFEPKQILKFTLRNIVMSIDMKTKQKLCEHTNVCEFGLYINEFCGNINKSMFKHGGAYADQL